jgi:hypothetical protein
MYINSVGLIYLIVYLLMNFPASYIIDKKGLRLGVKTNNY